jgi:hypothetical protein
MCYQVRSQYFESCFILMFGWKDLGDTKNNVPRSSLFQTRLNQQAANILWYHNKKDEGVVFEKAFSPFPIPALALVYTAVSCAIAY